MFQPHRLFYSLLLLGLPLLAGCINIPFGLLGNNRGKVTKEYIEPAKGWFVSHEILLIPLDGMVSEGDKDVRAGKEPGMLVALKDRLKTAKDDPAIKAVVLRINSPGGTITASDLIYREIMQFKAEKKVPVIAALSDTAASGGLYISMAADEIYALPSTVTGSIGAIMMLPSIRELSNKIGLEMRVIKSGRNKDIGSPWGQMTPEQRKIFQNLIDDFYKRFFQLIVERRAQAGLTAQGLKPIADGRILDPETALKAHLIDGIKYPDEVLARAKELAKITDAAIVSYEYPMNYRGNIYAATRVPERRADADGGTVNHFNLFNINVQNPAEMFGGAEFYYLWIP